MTLYGHYNNRLLRCAGTCSACLMAPTLSQWIFLFRRRWLPPLLQRQGRGILCLRGHHSGHQGKTDVVHNITYIETLAMFTLSDIFATVNRKNETLLLTVEKLDSEAKLNLSYFSPYFLFFFTSTKEAMFFLAYFLFVCLVVNKITQKVTAGFC